MKKRFTLLFVSLLAFAGVMKADVLVAGGIYTISVDLNMQRGEMVAADGYDYPVLDGIDLSGYTGNSTAACENGVYWYVVSKDNGATYYFYNIAKKAFLVNNSGVVDFGSEPESWTIAENASNAGYLNVKNETAGKYLSGGCGRTAANRPVAYDTNNNDGGALFTFTALEDGMTTFATEAAEAYALIPSAEDAMKTAAKNTLNGWASLSVFSSNTTVAEAIATAVAAVDEVTATGDEAQAAIDALVLGALDSVENVALAFQTTATDNNRNGVWVVADTTVDKAIGLETLSGEGHWTVEFKDASTFYIKNIAHSVYMGNPSGNCVLASAPASAYSFEIVDAANSVVEMKCGGETLHASNWNDNALINYDGNEAASRWTIVSVDDQYDLDAPGYDEKSDVTGTYITNADLSSKDGWTVSGLEKDAAFDTSLKIAEFYSGWGSLERPNGSFKQDITLPAGTYRLSGKAFYRQGNGAQDEPEKSLGYLVAGDNKALIKTLGSVNGTANSFSAAASAIYADDLTYYNELEFVLTEETTLSIGYEVAFDAIRSWFIVGEMKLEKSYSVPGALKPLFVDQAMAFCSTSSMALYSLPKVYSEFEALSTSVNEVYGALYAGQKVLDTKVRQLMDEMEAMTADIAAIDEAWAVYSETKYAICDIKDNSTPTDAAVKAAFDAAVESACDVSAVATVADLEAKVAEFEAARQAYVVNAVPTNGLVFDYTFLVENPNMDTDTGWSGDWGYNGGRYENGEVVISKFREAWKSSADGLQTTSTEQTLNNIPNGRYSVSADIISTNQASGATIADATGVSLFANDSTVAVATGDGVPEHFAVEVFVTDHNLTLGIKCVDAKANWVAFDNVKLSYVEALPDSLVKKGFLERYAAFEQLSENLDYSWNGITNTYYFNVQEPAWQIKDTIDKVTDMELLDSMIIVMNEAEENLFAAYALGGVYTGIKNAFIEIAGTAVPFNEEVGVAANSAIEGTYMAGYSIATIAELEVAIEELQTAFADFLSHAAPAEGEVHDLTAFYLENPSFETGDLTGWTVNGYSADTGVRENTGGYATNGTDGSYLFNSWWHGKYLSQEAQGLPNGAYRLTVAMAGGDDGNDATAYIVANEDKVGVNLSNAGTFVDYTLDFEITDGKLHIATVGGNDDDTADNPVGSFNKDGHWWYKADNFRLSYKVEIPDSIRYKAPRTAFVERVNKFGTFVESSAELSMMNGIKGTYAWPLFGVVDPMVANIDTITDMELLDSMIVEMDEATAAMEEAIVVYDEYKAICDLFWDAADKSTAMTQEVADARDMALQNSNYANYYAATIEDLEANVAEIKSQYLAYIANAWGNTEGTTFDVTFMAGVTPRAGDSYDATTDAWSASGTSTNAPKVTTADGRTAAMLEYNTRVGKEKLNSVVMQQTVWGLPNATYNVELYANAINNNYEVALTEGDTSLVYVSANGVKTPVVAKNATTIEISDVYAINGAVVTDDSLHLTLSKNDKDGTNWHTVQIKSIVLVAPTKIQVTGVTLDKSEVEIVLNDSVQLTATVAPADATVKTITWKSDDTDVAEVDETGKVIAVGVGKATITVTTENGKTAECTVTVSESVTGIESIEAETETIIYDLQGRRVAKMEKGIYIVNGRKVIVK